ncbi:MAG: DUF2169 domain-containing protein, partial [Myxococcales bacterium]|nr:DUF2169 domain-containing protein [Myxococcales bacterium]
MRIQSVSPLEVGGFAWRPRFGGHAFTVVVKATYQLRPGEAVLAEEQDPILEVDRHFEDDPASSVYAPSDLVPFREHAEVTLVGDAIAPSPVGSRALVARLAVGSVDKKVVVFGDRWLDADGRVRKGEPFRKIPLRYELAAASPDNPVGVEDDSVDDAGTRPLPNLEPFGTRGPDTQPAGFGPIGPAWAPRRRLLGAAELDETHWREHPIPEDVQGSYWNAAPRDQRLAELTEDTTIHLEHLHPHLPRLSTRLPGVKPRAFVERSGGAREIFLTADALWIDMTRGVCTLTWRGTFDIDAPEVEGLVAVAMEQPGERLCWPDVAALLDTTTSEVPSRRDSAPPPRASEPRPAAAPELLPESEPEPITAYPILDRAVGDDADAEDTMVLRQRKHAPSLPFLRETASAAPSLPPPTRPGSAPPPPPSRSPASPWAR